jgi:hypothetical protein
MSRKAHLYGDPCPSSYGVEPPSVFPREAFLRLPERHRCQSCSKRALKPPKDSPPDQPDEPK